MQNIKDSRQVLKAKEYLCNPLYWDVVYSYMQVNSEWDGVQGHPRIFPKRMANFSKISRELNITRQTVSKRMSDLEDGQKNKDGLHLIKKLENGDYELPILSPSIATLMPKETLRVLVSAFNEKTISIYVYLYGRWMASKEVPFKFTYSQLKTVIGLGTSSRSNDYIIKDILNILIKLELVSLKLDAELSDGSYKTTYSVVQMGDTISDSLKSC